MRVNRAKVTGTRRAVYDGREQIGSVEQRDTEYITFDRRGTIIGIFNTLSAAATACWRAAHGQMVGVS